MIGRKKGKRVGGWKEKIEILIHRRKIFSQSHQEKKWFPKMKMILIRKMGSLTQPIYFRMTHKLWVIIYESYWSQKGTRCPCWRFLYSTTLSTKVIPIFNSYVSAWRGKDQKFHTHKNLSRYDFVKKLIESQNAQTIVDLGCAGNDAEQSSNIFVQVLSG